MTILNKPYELLIKITAFASVLFCFCFFIGNAMCESKDRHNNTELVSVKKLKMLKARTAFSATILNNGKVLIAGGLKNASSVKEAEIYDPKNNNFYAVGGMNHARWGHQAVALNDDKVLIVGGASETGPEGSFELFDLATNQFEIIPNIDHKDLSSNVVQMDDGNVVIISTQVDETIIYIFQPDRNEIIKWGKLNIPRRKFFTALLQDGKILVAGGERLFYPSALNSNASASLEIIDLKSKKVELIEADQLSLEKNKANFYPEGSKIIFGTNEQLNTGIVQLKEGLVFFPSPKVIFDPRLNRFVFLGKSPYESKGLNRLHYDTLLLPNNRLLFIGGFLAGPKDIASNVRMEIYDLAVNKYQFSSTIEGNFSNSKSVLLTNGNVLLLGGSDNSGSSTNQARLVVFR